MNLELMRGYIPAIVFPTSPLMYTPNNSLASLSKKMRCSACCLCTLIKCSRVLPRNLECNSATELLNVFCLGFPHLVSLWDDQTSFQYQLHSSLFSFPCVQQFFFTGENYLEIDFDIHQYTYLARRAISAYIARLQHVVWETAFIVQVCAYEEYA